MTEIIINAKTKKTLKIAAILDEISMECLRFECDLVMLNSRNWKNQIMKQRPDFLFVESAWHMENKLYCIPTAKNQIKDYSIIKNLTDFCREMHIPTVFWNKEDPYNFETFVDTAHYFDYICTTDINSINKYKKYFADKTIFPLLFAIQPKIHNPVGRMLEKLGSIAFAGTWYNDEARIRNAELLLKPALKFGLHIYDRMGKYHYSSKFEFPEKYRNCIKSSLSYRQTCDLYKKYEIFLNPNIVSDSPTMFSRRVFELLASGTTVVSSYSTGIESLFPDIVYQCKTETEVDTVLGTLISDSEIRDKKALLGIRALYENHMYIHRLKQILDLIGIEYADDSKISITVVGAASSPQQISMLIENFEVQSFDDKQLIIVTDTDMAAIDTYNTNIRHIRCNFNKVKKLPIKQILFEASYPYIARFDSACLYGENYLRDIANAFKYSEADFIGKAAFYNYDLKTCSASILKSGIEYSNNCLLNKNAFAASKENFSMLENVDFSEICSEKLHAKLKANGASTFSIDRFNFLQLSGIEEMSALTLAENNILNVCKDIFL